MVSQYAGIDSCIRSYTKYSNDLDEFMGKCLEIAEDLNDLEEEDSEAVAHRTTLRSSLLSFAKSDLRLKRMSEATEECKSAMREFYNSNNTAEDAVPNLVKVYDEELQRPHSSDSAESHQMLKDFDNILKSPRSRDKQTREVEEPMEVSGVIFSQVEEALYCPITKKPFEDPVRNKLCSHCYSKAAICQILTRKNAIKCPVGGCTKQVMMPNLIPDRDLARRVKRKLKQDKYDRHHTAESPVQL